MSQLNPSSRGAHAARPSSQCKFTNRKWQSIKSAFTAVVRMSAGFFSPGHFSKAHSEVADPPYAGAAADTNGRAAARENLKGGRKPE
eukprot:12477824-Alexandrium_andersonii.AAC.1